MVTNRTVALFVGSAFALLHAGCSDTAQLSDGIHLGSLPSLQLVEELRIGSVSDPEIGFSQIGGIAVDAQGLVYVADVLVRTIKVYDGNGQLLRAIGGPGDGPGEFQHLSGIGVIGDTLWATDLVGSRVTLFERSGDLVETIRIEPRFVQGLPGGVAVSLRPGELRSDGFIVSAPMVSIAMPVGAGSEATPTYSYPVVLFDRQGVVVDTMRMVDGRTPTMGDSVNVQGRWISVPAAPSDAPLVIATAEGSWEVDRSVAAANSEGVLGVTHIRGKADSVFVRQFRYEPRRYGAADVEKIIEPIVQRFLRAPEPDGGADLASAIGNALRDAVELPAHMVPVHAGQAGQDGVVWLRMDMQGEDWAEYLLIGPDGQGIGIVNVPGAAVIHWSNGSIVWAAVPGDFDVPWLVRYRLLPGP